MFKVKSKN